MLQPLLKSRFQGVQVEEVQLRDLPQKNYECLANYFPTMFEKQPIKTIWFWILLLCPYLFMKLNVALLSLYDGILSILTFIASEWMFREINQSFIKLVSKKRQATSINGLNFLSNRLKIELPELIYENQLTSIKRQASRG